MVRPKRTRKVTGEYKSKSRRSGLVTGKITGKGKKKRVDAEIGRGLYER
jgi:hypothetical protein